MPKSIGSRLTGRLRRLAGSPGDLPPGRLEAYVDLCALLPGDRIAVVGWIYNPDAPAEVHLVRSGEPIARDITLVRGRRPDVARRFDDDAAPWGFVALANGDEALRSADSLSLVVQSGGTQQRLDCVLHSRGVDDVLQSAQEFAPPERSAVMTAFRDAGLDVAPSSDTVLSELSDLDPFVDACVDYAVAIPDHGVFFEGWLFDPEDSLVALHVCCDGIVGPNLLSHLARFERQDVDRRFGATAGGPSRTGMLAYCPMRVARTRPKMELLAVTRASDSATIALPWTKANESASESMRAIMKRLDASKPGAAERLREHLGPALFAYWQTRARWPTSPRVRDFGEVASAPTFSVVVASGDRRDALLQQLARLAHDPDLPRVEVLWVVREPFDEARLLETLQDTQPLLGVPVRVVCPGRRLGWSEAIRLGAERAAGRYIALLGPSIVPSEPGWLGRCRDALDSLPNAGAVGGRVLRADETVLSEGLYFGPDDRVPGVFRKRAPTRGVPAWSDSSTSPREVPALSAECLVMKRELYEQLGPLDDGYAGDFDEAELAGSDLALAARAAGRRIYALCSERFYDLQRPPAVPADEADYRRLLSVFNSWRLTERHGASIRELCRAFPEVEPGGAGDDHRPASVRGPAGERVVRGEALR